MARFGSIISTKLQLYWSLSREKGIGPEQSNPGPYMGQYKFIILKYNFNRSISSLSLHEKEGEKKKWNKNDNRERSCSWIWLEMTKGMMYFQVVSDWNWKMGNGGVGERGPSDRALNLHLKLFIKWSALELITIHCR